MRTACLTAFIALIIISCNSGPSEKELALKEKELELKEKELALQKGDRNIVNGDSAVISASSKEKATASSAPSIESLLGCWAVEENQNVHLRFFRNGYFSFQDYNRSRYQWENLQGTFELRGESLNLLYEDRPKQTFRFYKSRDFANKYFIQLPSNKKYFFVKADCERMKEISEYESDTMSIGF